MERKGLLSAMLSLVVVLGLAAVPATAKPRHHRHHARAVSAEKGGDKGQSDNSGKGNGNGQGNGNGNAASQGGGQGNGNAQGSAGGQGNGDTKVDDPSNAPNGNGNGQSNGNVSTDAPGNSGSGGGDNGNGQGNGKSEDAPGADVKPGKSTPDSTISADVPDGLIGAPDIPLAILPVEFRPHVGSDVLVAPVAGQVLVGNGDGGFVPLAGAARVPVGAFVDANQGVITLINRLPDGTTQTGSFAGAKFQVRQTANGMTTLVLRGSSFRDICGKVTTAADDGGPADRGPTAGAASGKSPLARSPSAWSARCGPPTTAASTRPAAATASPPCEARCGRPSIVATAP